MSDMAERLRFARERAGFATAKEASDRFGWGYSTYAGHENGARGLKQAVAQDYARAFRVDLSWLLTGSGTPDTRSTPAQQGFGESEIEPWTGPGDVIRVAARSLRHAQTYKGNVDYPGLAIAAGDILVIEAKHDAKPGDLVVANQVDVETTTARRIVRRFLPPYLVGGTELSSPPITIEQANIIGTVEFVIRLKAEIAEW